MLGYLLTADFEDQGNRHLLNFFGTSDKGPFRIVVDNFRPLFFIERSHTSLRLTTRHERKEVKLTNFNGVDVDCLYFDTQRDLYTAKDELQAQGIRTYEADVRSPERYLMERFINASLFIEGQAQMIDGILTYKNPVMKKANYRPTFNVMSLDIETSMGNDLYSIGIHQIGAKEIKKVYMVGDSHRQVNEELYLFPSERELLIQFNNEFLEIDPDIIVGWHIIGFDFRFLEGKFKQYNLPFNLARANGKFQISEKKGMGWFSKACGRVVIDGPPALRNAFYSFDNFKLETVAREVLGTGKDIASGGPDKVEEITRRFHEDKESLAKYNLLDCTLVLDIFAKTGLIDLIVTRTLLSGMLMDRIGVSTGAFDHFMLPSIHRKGVVIGNVIDIERLVHAAGGHVMSPKEGLHEHVVVLDFKSLYPSIIRTFKIDPYSRIKSNVNTVTTPVGISFSKTEHILPDFIENLFEKRKEAKIKGDDYLSQAIKILMNSFYGVMGSGGSRFYHADLPTAITGTGQWILKNAMSFLEGKDYEVVYGDTDSVFVKLKFIDIGRVHDKANQLAESLNKYFSEKIMKEFRVESHLEIEYEKYYRKLYFPPARSGEGGAKKRYVGLLQKSVGIENIHFSGMEYVRSDWTKLAKKFQMELYEKFFAGVSVDSFIKDFIKEFKENPNVNDLIYKKRLTKSADEYIKSIPPHVKAAKLLIEKTGHTNLKSIRYVITRRGPIPIDFEPKDIDYDHYIEKQIRPIAEDVLKILEKSFDDLTLGDQLTLF
ncbi:DNA polymerase II [Bacteriovorax sp. BSW11_IV]|uniref:DNA polymerase II n=1 Tax=Bacteriovorax sp. BSW11_IV TaxID=1353529 RepID=UPI000427F255|nr:DNA polymerase II [Bacteriovorax sp. BSW11_IV]